MTEINTHKAVAYAVEMPPPRINTHKAVAYAAELLDPTGDAKQSVSGERPIYRVAPIPHVEFAVGTSLDVVVVVPGVYTLVLYKPDGTFYSEEMTLPTGLYTLPDTDFNQALLYQGAVDARFLRRIKLSMELRA